MSRIFRLGLFICATFLILGAGIFLIGTKQLMFRSTFEVRSQFQNVSGLNEGADVRVGGIRRGIVKNIVLPNRSDGKMTVVMELDDSTRRIIKKDSLAYIRSEGLLGDKYVEVSFGSNDAPVVADGQTIASEPPFELSDLMQKTNAILSTTQGAMQNVEGTADNLKEISGKINRGEGTVGALINDKTIYQRAAAGATAFQEDMEALKHNFLLRGFFRNRGYESSADLTKHAINRLPPGPYLKTFEYSGKGLFDKPENAKLKREKLLKNAGTFLEQNRFGSVVVSASMGIKGDAAQNRELELARAMVVRDYLTKNFRLDDARIKTFAAGEVPGTDDGGELKVLIYPPRAVAPQSRPN
jgi:phospholipid/cholesterol/gamma-HCH transport system substrate-binding protein